jgi:Putative lipoprotein LpqV
MRRNPIRSVLAATLLGSIALSGCASGSGPGATSSSAPKSSPSTTTSTPVFSSHTAAPGAVGKSPAGVTTAVGAPAESTEDEYFQACNAAKTWMAQQGGELKSQFEPYLAFLQSSDTATPGTFGTPWSQLAPGRQSAVIVAADAASNALCG